MNDDENQEPKREPEPPSAEDDDQASRNRPAAASAVNVRPAPPTQEPNSDPEANYIRRTLAAGQTQQPWAASQLSHRPRLVAASGPPSLLWPALLFLLVLALGLTTLMASQTDTAEAEDKPPAYVAIEDDMVYFEYQEATADYINFEISVFATNYGQETSEPLKMAVYAIDTDENGLGDNFNRTFKGIEGQKSAELTLPITLALNSSYKLDFYLYEGGMIKVSAVATFNAKNLEYNATQGAYAYNLGLWDSSSREDNQVAPAFGSDDDSAGFAAAPGFSGVLAALALAIALNFYYRRERP